MSYILFFSIGYKSICNLKTCIEHLRSTFLMYAIFTSLKKMSSGNFLIGILLVEKSRNPNWIDVYLTPYGT